MDISFGAAFLAGILAFFSPCVLPLIPGILVSFLVSRWSKPRRSVL